MNPDFEIEWAALEEGAVRAIVEAGNAELARRAGRPARVALCIDRGDPWREGEPWIGRVVSWPVGGRPKLEFGGYDGEEVEILAKPGDVVMWGQPSGKGARPRDPWRRFGIVTDSFKVQRVREGDAAKRFRVPAEKAS